MPARALILAALLSGCASVPRPEASTVVARYLASEARDDPEGAYALLSESARKQLSKGEFVARWRASVAERQAQAGALKARLEKLEERAEIELADGRVAALAREGRGWRLAAPRPLAPGASTPEEALARLVRALEERDFDAMLSLLGEPLRSVVERELGARLARLREARGRGLQIDGERARLRYDSHYYIELRRDSGRWRVVDFN
jgi:hypothetical protein